MSKKIIVTEKPSVARTFAEVLGVKHKENGYFEDDNWIITWCLGHLITMKNPDEIDPEMKRWKMETLPFLPENYQYKVIDAGDGGAKKQFFVIKKLYNRPDIDTIYYAGDPAREGLYIQMLVRQAAGHNPGANELVVWIDSQTPAEIRRGIKEAKPLSAYDDLKAAGYIRAIEDYAVGMNLSRAITLKYQNVLNIQRPFAVGRVMTCVLGMIVRREREIRNFVPKDFYRISSVLDVNGTPCVGVWKADKNTALYSKIEKYLANDGAFQSENVANQVISHLGDKCTVEQLDIHEEKKNAPLLFNLAELQALCSKLFKISPDETLKIAQNLYQLQLITYPRTDSRYLSSAIADVIDQNLLGLLNYDADIANVINRISSRDNPCAIKNTRYTNDAKVDDHYALIPTGQNLSALSTLNDTEKKVYDLIVRRFVAIFMEPAVFKKVNVSWRDNRLGEQFVSSGSSLKTAGYMDVYTLDRKGDTVNPAFNLIESDGVYDSEYRTVAGKTTPPKRYTSGSIILAMENAGQLIEDEDLRAQIKGSGIGTSATRAETISKLIRNKYISLNNKTQVLMPTALGETVFEAVKECVPEMLVPEMTAKWEQHLSDIANGALNAKSYRGDIENYVMDAVEKIKAANVGDDIKKYAQNASGAAGKKGKTMGNYKASAVKSADITTYLNVPFADKDQAKALGARFDGAKKLWYVPKGADLSKFERWLNGGKAVKSVKKIMLSVPYEDKDQAKALGARFDGGAKKWYITTLQNLEDFAQWIDD